MNPRTPSATISPVRAADPDAPAVREAERKVGAVLDDLESQTGGEVRDIDLDDMVDTDEAGRPVIRKSVDIDLQRRPARQWSRS